MTRRQSLALRPGSLGLIALRVLGLVVLGTPAGLAAASGISAGVATDPTVVAREGPLPLALLAALLGDALPPFSQLVLLGSLTFLVFDWALSAALLEMLVSPQQEPRLSSRIAHALRGRFAAFARIALLSVFWLGAGSAVGGALVRYLSGKAARDDWSVTAELIVLPASALLSAAGWSALVGAFALACRTLCVVDGRRRVLRCALEVVRVALRMPSVLFVPALLALVVEALGLVLLGSMYPPELDPLRALVWLAFLLVHACVWHLRVTFTHACYADPRFDPVRARGDAPLGVARSIRGLLSALYSRPWRSRS